MRINLIVVGKLKEHFWKDAIKEYSKRVQPFCKLNIVEVAEQKTLELEAVHIKKHLKGYVVSLDIDGTMCSSKEFAKIFEDNLNSGQSQFSIIIGSSNGLHSEIKRLSNKRISFGKVTYPHQLVRVMAMEQLYRAMTILNNITYHK